jgi:hypothetical protein
VIKEKAYLGTELRLPAPQMYMLPIEIWWWTEWRFLLLDFQITTEDSPSSGYRWRRQLADMDGSCKYIE